MARTEIQADQILDETIQSADIKDGTIMYNDLNDTSVGDNLTKKIIVDSSLKIISSTGVSSGKGEVTIGDKSGRYGEDFAFSQKIATQTQTGATFATYQSLVFNVSDTPNAYELIADFLWSHDSGANSIRIMIQLDGANPKEMFIEPQDANIDQRIPSSLKRIFTNLSVGSHTLTLEFRPATTSRVSTIYEATLTAKRVI